MEEVDNKNLESENIKEKSYNISHLVSANQLRVYIRIELFDKDADISTNDITDYLKNADIVVGIRENEIKEYCEKRDYSKELLAAYGIEPVTSTDAKLIYDFDIFEEKPTEKEDGTIDFHNLNKIRNVKKDDVLCHIIPAKDGVDGVNVFGKTIDFKKGRNVDFNNGKNTYISQDGLQLKANTDGCVEISNGKVYVNDVYVVNDVDNETGNIDFVGDVVINGDVKAGFSVKSKGNIKIKGMVEGAFIKSEGDIIINKGMNGMGRGSIYAMGNITSKYIENSDVFSEKSIFAESLINSNVVSKESIILKGTNAVIMGGISKAEEIYAKTIGSKTNIETNIIIDLSKYQNEQIAIENKSKLNKILQNNLDTKIKKLREIESNIDIVENVSIDAYKKNILKRKLIMEKIKLNNEVSAINAQLEEKLFSSDINEYKVICKGLIYANTRITIGWMKYYVRQDISYSKLYMDGNDIVVTALNSSDLK